MNESARNNMDGEEFRPRLLPNGGVEVRIAREVQQNENPIDRYRFVHYRVLAPTMATFITMPDPEGGEKPIEYLISRTDLDQGVSKESELAVAANSIGISLEQLLRGAKLARDTILEQQSQ